VYIKPVHTSTNVEATGNFVVCCCFDIVAGVDGVLVVLFTDSVSGNGNATGRVRSSVCPFVSTPYF